MTVEHITSFKKRREDAARAEWTAMMTRAEELSKEGKYLFSKQLLEKAKLLRIEIDKFKPKPASRYYVETMQHTMDVTPTDYPDIKSMLADLNITVKTTPEG